MDIIKAYLSGRYGQIHYRMVIPLHGSALPPLLCLHQTPGNGSDWVDILPELGADRVVIAPDTPGYGMSDPPPAPVAIEDFAREMIGVMDALAASGAVVKGPFDVMGYHTGSLIGTELARSWPPRVRRLVLFGLAAYDAAVREAKLARLRETFPLPANDLSHVEKLWAIFGQLSDARMSAEDRHVRMAECLRLGSRMPWAYIAVYKYDFLQAMTEVEQSTLIVCPQDDLWDVTRATSDRFPRGRRWDIPGASHGVLAIEKDKILCELGAFLNA